MKLSFSTGGWPFSLEECASLAKEMRYDGLEISTESLNRFEQSGAPLSPGRLHDTVRRLNEDALSIAALKASDNWETDEVLALDRTPQVGSALVQTDNLGEIDILLAISHDDGLATDYSQFKSVFNSHLTIFFNLSNLKLSVCTQTAATASQAANGAIV